MRHRKAGRKLNRTPAHRRALFRNLVTALLEHESIRTTDPKAKEIRRLTDRMITLGKRGGLHERRRALAFINKPSVVRKLFSEVAPRFANRAGGYTRVVKMGRRLGDAAPQSIVELTERPVTAAATERPPGGSRRRGGGRKPETTREAARETRRPAGAKKAAAQ